MEGENTIVLNGLKEAVKHSRLLTVSEVAAMLNVHRQSVLEWLWLDAFPNRVRAGEHTSKWYIPAADVEAFVNKHTGLPSRGMLKAQQVLEQREAADA